MPDSIETAPLDWDSPDWGGHVRVASDGSWVGAEVA